MFSDDITPRWKDRARKRFKELLASKGLVHPLTKEQQRLLEQLGDDAKFPRSIFEWYVQIRRVIGWTPDVETGQSMCCPTCKRS